MPAHRVGCERRIAAAAGIFVLLGFFSACSGNEASTGTRDAQAISMGSALYQQNCSACHDANDLQLVKKPPRLIGLFQKPALPSGAPATDQQVKKTILDGRGIMPPFKQTLDEGQVNDLLKYLHSR